MKYGKEHKLKKHDSSAQIYVGLKLQRRNLNSNLQHLKDLIPALSYLLLMDFELHKDYISNTLGTAGCSNSKRIQTNLFLQ